MKSDWVTDAIVTCLFSHLTEVHAQRGIRGQFLLQDVSKSATYICSRAQWISSLRLHFGSISCRSRCTFMSYYAYTGAGSSTTCSAPSEFFGVASSHPMTR